HILIQNNASPHSAKDTIKELEERRVRLDKHYGYISNPSYNQLRVWLQRLLAGMSQRCQEVYDADSGHTKH
ncbi:hypothetical protein F5B21DRAFT_470050, partial [Xylaria acuta]